MANIITVITLSRKRLEKLLNAIRSVGEQEIAQSIHHIILIDDCAKTREGLNKLKYTGENTLEWKMLPRPGNSINTPARVAFLRNYGINKAKTKWISFLDDDNEFEPNHLSSLLECIQQSGVQAAHSWRKIFNKDGTPYLEERMPWCRSKSKGKEIYQDLKRKGLFIENSNTIADRADPLSAPDRAQMVDMGEWLFSKKLLLAYPFKENYSHEDFVNMIPEDNKLLQALMEGEIKISSTKLPTLRYYLGGYSNAFSEADATSEIWNWQE